MLNAYEQNGYAMTENRLSEPQPMIEIKIVDRYQPLIGIGTGQISDYPFMDVVMLFGEFEIDLFIGLN